MEKKEEFEVFKVRVPAPIVEWLRFFDFNVEEWLEKEIVSTFGATLEYFFSDPNEFMAEKLRPLLERLKTVPYLAENHESILSDC